ncbi:MAG: NAD-dependent epimerase/dehydratase family protein [Kiritimatiellia bacterium]
MRILVKGAGGFVARHLINELTAHGHTPLGLDRRKPEPGHCANVPFFQCDLENADALRDIMAEGASGE